MAMMGAIGNAGAIGGGSLATTSGRPTRAAMPHATASDAPAETRTGLDTGLGSGLEAVLGPAMAALGSMLSAMESRLAARIDAAESRLQNRINELEVVVATKLQ